MNEMINCPMCGKANPPGSEACGYCQARIVPLVGKDASRDDWTPDSTSLPDNGLSFDQVPDPSSAPKEPDQPLINGIPGSTDSVSIPGDNEAGLQEINLPDWLQAGDEAADEKKEDKTTGNAADNVATVDWLGVLSDDDSSEIIVTDKFTQPVPGSLSWFEENSPDLSDMKSDTSQEEDNLLKWVSSLEADRETDDFEPTAFEIDRSTPGLHDNTTAGILEDRIDKISDQHLEVIPEPDSFLNLPTESETVKNTSEPDETDLPPWMLDTDLDDAPFQEPPREKHDFTEDFLLPLEEAPKQVSDDFHFETIEPSEDSPLSETRALEVEEKASIDEKDIGTEPETEEIPEFLIDTQADQGLEKKYDLISASESELGSVSKQATSPSPEQDPATEQEGVPSFLEGEMADWMKGLSEQEDLTDPEEPGDEPEPVVRDVSEEQIDDLPQSDLPDWLDETVSQTSESEEAKVEEIEETTGETESGIAPGMVPAWLAAMRPVEAVLPDAVPVVETGEPEASGPLAGLHSVIPGEDLVTQYRKPPVYSSTLLVSDQHKRDAALFDRVIAAERTMNEPGEKRKRSSGTFLRILISILLIAAILLPRFLSFSGGLEEDISANSAISGMQNALGNLPSGGKVLLAVDFEPGYYGELSEISQGVIADLLLLESEIVLISTIPTGPVMANQLLIDGMAELSLTAPQIQNNYSEENRVINLGYLVGGAAALKEFALQPRLAVRNGMALKNPETDTWRHPVLKDVNSINDFSGLIVLTDTAERGRVWVEQVEPQLLGTPILFVPSAQAVPMLLPYELSGQITAMMHSYGESAVINQMSGSPGALDTLEAYRNGILVILILILAGVLGNSLSGLFKKRKHSKEGI